MGHFFYRFFNIYKKNDKTKQKKQTNKQTNKQTKNLAQRTSHS